MTVEDFVREYGDDDSLELIDGEVCERELNGVAHFCIKNRISQLFNAAGIGKLSFASFVGASFGLTSRMGVTPDVSIIGNLQPICRTAPTQSAWYSRNPDQSTSIPSTNGAALPKPTPSNSPPFSPVSPSP